MNQILFCSGIIFLCTLVGYTNNLETDVHKIIIKSSIDAAEQPADFYVPLKAKIGKKKSSPVPLLLSLHTWSKNYDDYISYKHALEQCQKRGWIFISPQFRGPNSRPEACASDIAVQDVLDAVDFAKKNACVDNRRIYVLGASGGGHMTLIMAERAPHLWAAVSAWVPITDLAAWHDFCTKKNIKYDKNIEACLGGLLSKDTETECRKRSPLFWLAEAKGMPMVNFCQFR